MTKPDHRQPDNEPVCRICGCDNDHACDGGCSRVEDPAKLGSLCSLCLPAATLEGARQ